jgi:hypothetical protein
MTYAAVTQKSINPFLHMYEYLFVRGGYRERPRAGRVPDNLSLGLELP